MRTVQQLVFIMHTFDWSLFLFFSAYLQSNLVATCGADTTVQLFDVAQQRQVTSLTGHSKKVTAAVWGNNSCLVTASNDKTVRFWQHSAADADSDNGFGSWACGVVGSEHSGEVRGLAIHPSGGYVVSVSEDATWAWWDVAAGTCLKQVGNCFSGGVRLCGLGYQGSGLDQF